MRTRDLVLLTPLLAAALLGGGVLAARLTSERNVSAAAVAAASRGNQIALVEEIELKLYRLSLVDPVTLERNVLLEAPFIGSPEWSPDGGKLAVSTGVWANDDVPIYETSPISGITVIDFWGGSIREIVPPGLLGRPFTWTSDGQWLTFSAPGRLDLIRPDGTEPRVVVGGVRTPYGDPLSPVPSSWSLKGNRILYNGWDGWWVADRETGERWSLTLAAERYPPGFQHRPYETPAWTPDGDLVYAWNGRRWSGIYLTDPRLFQRTRLLTVKGVSEISIAPDGRIAYAVSRGSNPSTPIYITGPRGGRSRLLTESGQDLEWSADGTQVAFVREYGNNLWGVFVEKADGSRPDQVVRASPPIAATVPWLEPLQISWQPMDSLS